MTKNKFLYVSLASAFIFLVLHYLGMKFHLYWIYRWYDIPLHLLGGFWLSLLGLWISVRFGHIDSIVGYKSKALIIAVISAFVIGIAWEIFELIAGLTSLNESGYLKDFSGDVFFTFLGGVIAYLYFIKRRACPPGVNCILEVDKKL